MGMSPENWWLEDVSFPFNMVPFSGDILIFGGASAWRSTLLLLPICWSFSRENDLPIADLLITKHSLGIFIDDIYI